MAKKKSLKDWKQAGVHMAKPKGEGWKQIGCVGVDSGQLLITDPCYIDSEWEKEEFKPEKKAKHSFSYAACCEKTVREESAGQLKYRVGHAGVGVVCSSGIGDGFYPVYALFKKLPGAGVRIVEVRIDFIEHPLINGAQYKDIESRNEVD